MGAIVTLFLPETCNENLPSTIESANEFGRNQTFGYCILCSKSDSKTAEVDAEEQLSIALIEDTLNRENC